MSIGDRLKQIRAHLGFDQRQMAAHLELPARTYQDHELDKSTQKLVFFENLLQRGFSADWLLTGEGSMFAPHVVSRSPPHGFAEFHPKYGASQPIGLRLNEDLLKVVVSEIERTLNDADAELTPEKKAELVVLVYELALEGEGADQPVDRSRVIKLIRLAG
jgi:transcriptional regulator with XRE-family HTH domain